ncbi:hypothetical protein F5Y03DRAFT_401221 [Xylaria venustula]|nr:hypothetical protein F5Y03DRAFT_401221 [Xylaria venustula]
MSFGSTGPTPGSQAVLQLQWDCRQNKGVACQLINSWIAGTDETVLNEEERRTIAETLRMEFSGLLSLLIGWEQAILEKKRYDGEGPRAGNSEAQLSSCEFMILFQITYYRAQAGLTILPVSTSDSAGPTNIYLPTEIWHAITTWLDPFDEISFLDTHRGARGVLTGRQLQHSRLWMTVFKNNFWISKVLSYGLQPIVIGRQLDNGPKLSIPVVLFTDLFFRRPRSNL